MTENQNIEYKESWRDEYLKWICGFANAQGGRIYIGINDRSQVVGVSDAKKLLEDIPNKIVNFLGIVADVNLLKSDGGKDYIEIVVAPSNIPIAYHGQYHYRSGSTKQELKGVALQQFILKKMGVSWDDIVQPLATIENIDPAAIDFFQRSAISHGRMMESDYSSDIGNVLESLDLVDEDGHIRNAALLLFGKRPSRYFTLCDFRIGRFIKDETDLIFQDVIEGDLIRMADRVVNVLRSKYLTTPIHYVGLGRFEPLEIPEKALREAIFNAIIHKDYTGVHIQMKVFNDRIELWNQGTLPVGWTVEKMLAPHSSQPRNKHIAAAFYKAGFIESWGRGVGKIIEGFLSAGLPAPSFKEHCGGLLLTIPRPTAGVSFNDTINSSDDTINDTINSGGDTIKRTYDITDSDTPSLVSDTPSHMLDTPSCTPSLVSDTPSHMLDTSSCTPSLASDAQIAVEPSPQDAVFVFCRTPRSIAEIADMLGVNDRKWVRKKYIMPFIGTRLQMIIPDKPRSSNQKYKTIA